jgi:hypothetical protein
MKTAPFLFAARANLPAAFRFAHFARAAELAISDRRSGLNFLFRNFTRACAPAFFFFVAMFEHYHTRSAFASRFLLTPTESLRYYACVSRNQAFEPARRPIYQGVKPVRNPAYLAFIRKLCCVICGSYRNVEAAHFGSHGMGQKSSDHDALPLCLKHHRFGPHSYHVLGARRFIEFHSLKVAAHQERLRQFYQEKAA